MSKRTEQKLMGLVLCSMGTTPKDQDATAVVMLAPLALWLIFSKEIVIY